MYREGVVFVSVSVRKLMSGIFGLIFLFVAVVKVRVCVEYLSILIYFIFIIVHLSSNIYFF